MASGVLPTRHRRDESIKRQKSKSDREILLQMGFSKQRAEKAIASTGDCGVQLASDWLLSHVNDPHLDKNNSREYILYLCPKGALQKEIVEFAEKSLNSCGWNGSHAYFPHITLCPFFTVEDAKTHDVTCAVLKLETKLRQAPGKLKLDFFSQMNFIGLFLQEDFYRYLSDITNQVGEELKNSGIKFEPHKKQLHMTLAYQYQPDQHEKLLTMAKDINFDADVQWDFRLYSRDISKAKCEVRKVLKAYTPQLGDELELIDGDFVYVEPSEIQQSKDQWYKGISWLTGNSGLFPGPYTQRTADTRTWTLHRSLPMEAKVEVHQRNAPLIPQLVPPLIPIPADPAGTPPLIALGTTPLIPQGATPINHQAPSLNPTGNASVSTQGATSTTQSNGLAVEMDWTPYDNLWHDKNGYAQVKKKPGLEKSAPRKLYIVRHGERVDFALGKEWFDMCYDDDGHYKRNNLNLLRELPKRKTHLEYIKDPPLTVIGHYQATLTAENLLESGVTVFCIYCSPSLRCVQTATQIFKVFNLPWKLRIEPGLYEWTGYQAGVPRWMSPSELLQHGYPVDTTYTPQYPRDKLQEDEPVEVLYARSTESTKQILKNHELEGGNLLFVGHAGTLELCTRQLIGRGTRNITDYKKILPKVPYCSVCAVEEDPARKKWAFIEPPSLALTHGRNHSQRVIPLLQ
ncbi:ubiquitin-associated and SH3 domain-containing protein B-like [Ylistrum balloti]|uniref:ubiquitin-associated and SH3 domain-containing protein B-like n=1 Tax=Ylistrum balloti TaxID=509963 RepID=UPI002905E533|nr:ubiquitin-associated and SH3 domain-containing protein B-like [Ylistrum balloti]